MIAPTFILIVLFVGALVLAAFRIAFALGRDALLVRRLLFVCGVFIQLPALFFAWQSAAQGWRDSAGGAMALAIVGLVFIAAAKFYPTR